MPEPETTKWTTLCGDPTCNSYGCSQEAIDAWNKARDADARAIVRSLFASVGIEATWPDDGGDDA